jgi:predicted TPR repeat methyltransferase
MANTKDGTVEIAGCGTDSGANKKLYDDWGGKYEADVRSWGYEMPEKVAEKIKSLVPEDKRAAFKILDAGAGDGLSGKAITDCGFEEVTGIDVSAELIKIARKNKIYKRAEVADLNKPVKFRTDEFDAITIVGVMTYLENDGCC